MDVVRRRRQEQAKSLADASAKQLQALGTDLLLRGKAALLAAADAAVNPDAESRRARKFESPAVARSENEQEDNRTQSGQLAQSSASDRGFELTDGSLLTLLCATAVGAAFGAYHADTHTSSRERRLRVADRTRRAVSGTKVRGYDFVSVHCLVKVFGDHFAHSLTPVVPPAPELRHSAACEHLARCRASGRGAGRASALLVPPKDSVRHPHHAVANPAAGGAGTARWTSVSGEIGDTGGARAAPVALQAFTLRRGQASLFRRATHDRHRSAPAGSQRSRSFVQRSRLVVVGSTAPDPSPTSAAPLNAAAAVHSSQRGEAGPGPG